MEIMRSAATSAIKLAKANIVFVVALTAAVVTMFFVPVTMEYINYFDFRTLTCLFCTLAVICALKNISFFQAVARKIVFAFKNLRAASVALVYITFIGSMIIANDMALITFLPLGYFVLDATDNREHMAKLFILQNIAANLGGMLTPFGNPQNLYLYSFFNIPTGEFVSIMALPFVISIALITAICFTLPKTALNLEGTVPKLTLWRTITYLLLFAFSIVIVFRIIPYYYGLIVIPIALLFLDKKALKDVDYGLLLTFCAFFVFSGNLARIPQVNSILSVITAKSPLLFGVLSCQCISNVPTAILLSRFTTNYQQLLVAVNIGGVGTLIASLASIITFREYTSHNKGKALAYIGKFSLYNFGMLAILTVIMAFVLR